MLPKHLLPLGWAFLVLAILPETAAANLLTRADLAIDCAGFDLRVLATDLAPGTEYTVDYTLSATVGGVSTPVAGAIGFTAAGSSAGGRGSEAWSLSADGTTVKGSATLTSSGSTLPVIVNGSTRSNGAAELNCAAGSWSQEGPKLVGRGAVGGPDLGVEEGNSAALAAGGSTAIAGGPGDHDGIGAAWVFVRAGGLWRQQGVKIIGSGAVGAAAQGYSVALSADGNTAVLGGPLDHASAGGIGTGAVWVFTRTAGVWRQQAKLVGADAAGSAEEGWSVALSADGNTLVLGGPGDGTSGAAWVFTRTGGVWQQQGAKLVGSGAVGNALEGSSVALSADGNTALVGGLGDNAGVGAVWVFTRAGGMWQQEGAKLVGRGAAGAAFQGTSTALSADGMTALLGGPRDDGTVGAAWVFAFAGDVWRQQGAKLVGGHAQGLAGQGAAVALSADGNAALVGGVGDNGGVGAAWAFARSGGRWRQAGPKLVGTGTVGTALVGASVSLSGDGATAVVGGPGDGGIGALRIFAAAGP